LTTDKNGKKTRTKKSKKKSKKKKAKKKKAKKKRITPPPRSTRRGQRRAPAST
jgi:hypothetical protein